MKLLITGGTGFVGSRLARELLKRGVLNGKPIEQLVLADQFPAPEAAADLGAIRACRCASGSCSSSATAFRDDRFDGVFHLASAVSGECEADFELGLRSNLDSTRALLDALRGCGQRAPVRVLQFGGGVRPRRQQPDAAAGARRHAADAADELWHAQAGVRAPGGRLHAQGLHRRPQRAADDGDRAARQAQRRGVVVLQRHHPRAARRAGGDPAGGPVGVAPGVVTGAHRRRA